MQYLQNNYSLLYFAVYQEQRKAAVISRQRIWRTTAHENRKFSLFGLLEKTSLFVHKSPPLYRRYVLQSSLRHRT